MFTYALHVFCCYLAILPAEVPIADCLVWLGLSGNHPGAIHFGGYEALTCLLLGLVAGWTVGKRKREFVQSGRWVWLVPIALMLWAVFPRATNQHSGPSVPWLPETLFATHANYGIFLSLVTLPAFFTAGYSIGIFIAARCVTAAGADGYRMSASRVWLTTTTVAVLFGLLVFLARNFELKSVERWSKIRSVIVSTLTLSPDEARVCQPEAPMTGSGLIVLQGGTIAESLEKRACSGGQLLPTAVLPSSDSRAFTVEKVRVLTGPYSGLEGFAREYGFGETEPTK